MEYQIMMSNDGIGIPQHLDINRTSSLDLQLVTTLTAHQLSGSLDLDRSSVTAFHIYFDEIYYKKRLA